jgi:nucleotide-binding universal stress UspA family protein
VQRLLVATDGSEAAESAVARAAAMARDLHGVLIVLTVTPRVPVALHVERERGLPVLEILDTGTARRVADAAVAGARRLGARATPLVAHGDPAERIVELAERERCDLVVVGSRGLGGEGALLLGSVSREVLARASMPVLIVKAGPPPST